MSKAYLQLTEPSAFAQRCEALDDLAEALDQFKLATARLADAASDHTFAGNEITGYPDTLPHPAQLATTVQAMHVGLTDL